ncbi:hypothetical protein My1_083 [Pectobacterium phage My1]|uniref:Uncharacterized protein n=1 Tax=Pectobacterium phage My1 TaxID=1204539 RepID=J9QNX1_9CAUD|nr:hypothetical protein My1_083 [Pectobacterium phage My1]AFQ22242.1 hypothetical protein My1_083 [Pectobacterium phage My1]
MRNFVAKNDFNRASTHRSIKDYVRVSEHEILANEELYPEIMEENWDVGEDDLNPRPKKGLNNTRDC